MQDLKKLFLKGMGWGVIDNLSGTGINFIVGIILARQLSPQEFGIVGIALVLIGISNVIIDGGLSNALIRDSKAGEREYATALTLNITVGLTLYMLFFWGAPWVSAFYKIPQLTQVIRLLSLVLLFNSITIVPKARLSKAVDFRKQAIASLCSSLISAAVGISMAFRGFGIWSLVAQQITRQSIYALCLWWQVHLLPRLGLNFRIAQHLLSFGLRILLSALLDSLYNNLYYMFIGKLYSPRQLGLYTRAEQFSSILAINFGMVLQKVSLPILTQSHENEKKMQHTFIRLLNFSTLFSALLCFSLSATAEHLIVVLIGPKWIESIDILRILCFAAFFQPLIIVHQNILQVYGKAKLFLHLEIFKKSFAVCIIVAGIAWSFTALLWGIVLISVLSLMIHAYHSRKLIPAITLTLQLHSILRYLLSIGSWMGLVYIVGTFIENPYMGLSVQLGVLALGGGIMLRFIFKEERAQIYSLLKRQNA